VSSAAKKDEKASGKESVEKTSKEDEEVIFNFMPAVIRERAWVLELRQFFLHYGSIRP